MADVSYLRTDPVSWAYYENYDQIARDDLAESIVPEPSLQRLAVQTVAAAGALFDTAVCDLGAGKGFLARALLAAGAKRVVAVDITSVYFTCFANEPRIEFVQADAECLPFDNLFGTIFCTDVMEHVLNLGSFLFCLKRALRPGGMAHVRVPADDDFSQYTPQQGCPYRFVHLRQFNEPLLHSVFGKAGFEIVAVQEIETELLISVRKPA